LTFAGANRASVGVMARPPMLSEGTLLLAMSRRAHLTAVVAAYNEGRAIGAVLAGLRGHADEVIVVDDGSGDDTAAAARREGATVVRHAINRGQGAALQTGISLALIRGADVIVTFDADGQHVATDVARVAAPVIRGEADVALGSRFLADTSRVPPFRRLVLKAAVVFTRLTTGLRITDAHNGLRAFSRRAAETIRIRQDRMAHASEILSAIRAQGLRYVEVPVTILYTEYSRAKGQSALGAFRVLLDLIVGKGVR
jgi:glycosyltransferase involved in cell wall biosynthesis